MLCCMTEDDKTLLLVDCTVDNNSREGGGAWGIMFKRLVVVDRPDWEGAKACAGKIKAPMDKAANSRREADIV